MGRPENPAAAATGMMGIGGQAGVFYTKHKIIADKICG